MDASVNRIPSSTDERTLLISLSINNPDTKAVKDSLAELVLLSRTAGANIVDSMIVKRNRIDPATIIGKGKLEMIHNFIREKSIRLLVFDLNNLKPAQVRTLEEKLHCRVVGRTEVILDIFARRARSAESKIQVELAQLRYILPRLKGLGGVLSRLGGGIGTRGPGEKMLETDRRHILRRISNLKKKLVKITKHRQRIRQSRSQEIQGAVVGYTNAGKSTLINCLAHDDLFVENRLFATLDSYTRAVFIDTNKKVLLTDTVGFIRNLPANLIESFKSSLEEIQNARFLIHVIDITTGDLINTIKTVHDQLLEIECSEKPSILFFNKSDILKSDIQERIQNSNPDAIIGSVKNNEGIDELKEKISSLIDIL